MEYTISFLTTFFGYSLLAFVLAVALEPLYYRAAQYLKLRKEIRDEAVDGRKAALFKKLHQKKSGTPTGGGIMIWGGVLAVILLSRFFSYIGIVDSSLLQRTEVYLPLFTLVTMGILGFLDDFWNALNIGGSKGIKSGPKMLFLLLFALLGAAWFYFKLDYTVITIPFWGELFIGWLAIPLYIFVIVGTANAVNVTDGLDGLAGGLLIFNFAVMSGLAFLRGHLFLSIFCGLIIAALLAFLWWNVPPAKFFMGDTGSLSLGATLGVIAMMIDVIAILPIIALPFVVEMLSVIIQLASKKFRNGKKVFLIAPLHHHFEAIGWQESQIVMRFWIVGAVCAILGLILGLVTFVS